jgi:hypothetical protein
MALDDSIRDIFWNFKSEEDVKSLPSHMKEELARYCIGKMLSQKSTYEARKVLVAIGEPALRFIFPAMEKDKYHWTTETIAAIAKKGNGEEDIAAKFAVGTLHNIKSRVKATEVIRATGKKSCEYLIYALDDNSIADFAENELKILGSNPTYKADVIQQLQKASDPMNGYKPLVRAKATAILNKLPAYRNL